MSWRQKKELFTRIGVVLVALACIPTLYWAILSVLQGNYGNPVDNFKGQPNYPIITLIVFAFLLVLFPIYYFKNKDRK